MKKQKGFTLIELLVVIAIIAILSTVVMAGLNSARMKGRDAKRLADIKQVQTALESCYDTGGGYPAVATAGTLSTVLDDSAAPAGSELCGAVKFTSLMNPLPVNPGPGGATYTYIGDTVTYAITFRTEGQQSGLPTKTQPADYVASPTGIL